MTILYDLLGAQPIGSSKFHGGGEYIKIVLKKLIEMHSNTNRIIVFYDCDRFLDEWVKKLIEEKEIAVYDVKTIFDVEKIFIIEKINVFYSGLPYDYYKIKTPINVKKIGTFHGMRNIQTPTDLFGCFYSVKMILRIAIRKLIVNREIEHYQKAVNVFDEIITVSSHSKYSMKHFLDIAKNKKINVFFSPRKFKNTYENINSYNSKETIEIGKYILMIGGNRWEKNVCRAIIALENLLEKGMLNDFRIVIVGELPKWVRKKIKHTEAYNLYGYLESEILESLYKNCSFFIFPSLNEGFGYPPLEAMAYGKTCIVSGVCALPEVCGSGVYYVNPYDINELKNRILQAIDTKIDPKIIEYYFDKTSKRQDEDLEKICDSIVSVNEN